MKVRNFNNQGQEIDIKTHKVPKNHVANQIISEMRRKSYEQGAEVLLQKNSTSAS